MLYAVAHQGPSGHRGRETTMQHLRGRFHWKNMESDIRTWSAGCLQCIKSAKGDIVPRPLGTQLVAEWPGEILMFDYFEIGPSDSGPTYLLLGVDKFTRFIELWPAKEATAVHASRAIVEWGSRYGLPRGGAPFTGKVPQITRSCHILKKKIFYR